VQTLVVHFIIFHHKIFPKVLVLLRHIDNFQHTVALVMGPWEQVTKEDLIAILHGRFKKMVKRDLLYMCARCSVIAEGTKSDLSEMLFVKVCKKTGRITCLIFTTVLVQ
jgi:hypothetical protein